MKERNRDQAWRMIVGFDRCRPTSDDIQMPTRRGNVGGRRSEASGFPARPGGVMPRHDNAVKSTALADVSPGETFQLWVYNLHNKRHPFADVSPGETFSSMGVIYIALSTPSPNVLPGETYSNLGRIFKHPLHQCLTR